MNEPFFVSGAYMLGKLQAIQLNSIMGQMSPEERLAIFELVHDEYCKFCGWEFPDGKLFCNCTNDE